MRQRTGLPGVPLGVSITSQGTLLEAVQLATVAPGAGGTATSPWRSEAAEALVSPMSRLACTRRPAPTFSVTGIWRLWRASVTASNSVAL